MKTTPLAILFLVASVLGAVGQFFYKAGADRAHGAIQNYFLNSRIVLGACCYLAVMVLFVAAFKEKAPPSALYPLYATTFIWAALLDHLLFGWKHLTFGQSWRSKTVAHAGPSCP